MPLVALPTDNSRGRHSVIAETLSRAKNITLVQINDKPRVVETLDNPFFQQKQGAGPLLAQHLKTLGVNLVIAKQVGPGSRIHLEHIGIKLLIDPHSIRVEQALTHLD